MHHKDSNLSRKHPGYLIGLLLILVSIPGCSEMKGTIPSDGEAWGIYYLDLVTSGVEKIYGSTQEISEFDLDPSGESLVFSQMTDGPGYEFSEIYRLSISDREMKRLTDNSFWDLYPVWSPDGTRIVFLSWRDETLDIYQMDREGINQSLVYDSGFHDADIDWVGEKIVFTSQSRIWIMDSDGSNPRQITDPPRAGEWGQANLPFGDYDPRLSPDGGKVVFSRLVSDESTHGNYDLFLTDLAGGLPRNLTGTGYSQGLSSWSPSGKEILFIVSAIGEQGVYDLYTINDDGTGTSSILPEIFPAGFLIHQAQYSPEGSGIYLIGQWWKDGN